MCLPVLPLLSLASLVAGSALTTAIGSSEHLYFYADINKAGEKIGFYFAVPSSRSFDINFSVTSPSSSILLDGTSEWQGDYILTASLPSEYAFCFSNPSSALSSSSKLIDFDIMVESEPRREAPAKPRQISEQTSTLEESVFRLNGMLMNVKRTQKYFHTKERRGFDIVQSTQNKLFWYAVLESIGVIAMAMFKVYIVVGHPGSDLGLLSQQQHGFCL